MHKVFYLSASALMLGGFGSAPALAQQQQQPQQTAKKVADPNEVICERQQDTGSRLASKRVCMTRAQWAEQRRDDRMQVEKVQTQRDLSH